MLDVGHSHTELCVFDGGEPSEARHVPWGGQTVTVALAKAFGVDEAQAERGKVSEGFVALRPGESQPDVTINGTSRRSLVGNTCREAVMSMVREIRRSLVAHEMRTGHAVERIYLTGGGSQLRGLPAYLESALGVEITHLDPLQPQFTRLADGGDSVRPYIAKALALSLRAFHRAHQSQLNFRKGEFAYTGDFGFMRGRLLTVAFAVVLMITLAGFGVRTQKQVLQAEYETLISQVRNTAIDVLGEETDDVILVLTAMGAPARSAAAAIPDVSAYDMLAELSKVIDFDLKVDVDRLELDLDKNKLEMHGKTGSGGDVERIVDAVQKSKCFKRVSKERVEKSVDDRTKFRLSAPSVCTQEQTRG